MDAFSLMGRILSIRALLFFLFLMALSLTIRPNIKKKLILNDIQFFLLSSSINVILALTMRWWDYHGTQDRFWLFMPNAYKSILTIDANWLFNFALFIPVAFLLKKQRFQSIKIILFLFVLSFTIETLQNVFSLGLGDPADLVANFFGGIFTIVISKTFFMKVKNGL